MSFMTQKNESQSIGSTQKDSLKAHFDVISSQMDDEFSTLQVVNTSAKADANVNELNTQKDDHEHPCVCDLRLTRKSLTNGERYAKAKDYLRNESKTNPSGTAKTLHASPNDSDKRNLKASTVSKTRAVAKSTNLKTGSSQRTIKKTKKGDDGKINEKRNKMKKEIANSGYEYQMLTEKTENIERKAEVSHQKFKKDTSERSKGTRGASSSTKSSDKNYSSPRKNIHWKKKPQIAVRMNRTANLRLEKGALYCGGYFTRQYGMNKVDEYFAKRVKRISAAKAEAEAAS